MEIGQDFKKPGEDSKEIIIKLNKSHLKTGIYVIVLAMLVGVIFAQQFGFIPTTGKFYSNITDESDDDLVGPIEDKKETPEPEEAEPEIELETEVIPSSEANSSENNQTNSTLEQEEDVQTGSETEEDLLPITGEIDLIVNKINIDSKPEIEDYAKITSVKFTILNQDDDDFMPTIKAYLTMYAGDEKKEITLNKLESGHSVTTTSTDLFFGFNEVDETHTLNLELYDENKNMLDSVEKTFTSSD